MRQVMVALSEGHLDVAVPHTGGRDEIAGMARAVNVFKDVSVAAVRAGSGLDAVTANVMMADHRGVITYVNPALSAMFAVAESDIRRVMPDFRAGTLIGRSIDSFHANPAHQHRIIRDLTGSYLGSARVGRRSFKVIANPVVSRLGVRLGTVIEWRDLTDELAIEDEIRAMVTAAAGGDLSRRIPLEGKTGFLGAVSAGINTVAITVADVSEELAAMLDALARGDLSRRIDKPYQGLFGRLKDDCNATADKLAQVVGRITRAADAIHGAAAEASAGSADFAARTERQASSLEETAAAIEQLGAAVRVTAGNAEKADVMVGSTRTEAEQGGALAESAIDAMKRIEQASHRITEIIGVMDEIAFQTNLLALNAAVEAARAGDAGKGFAVVAQEVRVLASRSAQASKEIKQLILTSDAEVHDGVGMVRRAGAALTGIAEGVRSVAAVIAEIAGTSREQASSLDEIRTAVTRLDDTTQKNAALIEETTAASQAMAAQANDLKDLMAFFVTAADAITAGQGAVMARHIALVEAARNDHLQFCRRLNDVLAGRITATPDGLPDHHQCRLGKWYDTVPRPEVRRSPTFAAVARPHAALHDAARRALRQSTAGQSVAAVQSLAAMTQASETLLAVLDRLAGELRVRGN
jgi:methyl-accepting chemotaxis protein